jgi:RND superfamily putative drug exporter
MFLVPSVMKLLGDDCWGAPGWARRLQNKIGLGEMDLPDERKRPTLNGRPARPPVAASLVAAAPRPPHDPTHPGPLGPSRPAHPGPAAPPEPRPAQEPSSSTTTTRSGADDSVDTTRIPARPTQPTEAKTTRFSAQGAPARDRPAAPKAPQAPQAPKRPPAPATPPSGDQTRAIPVPGNRPDDTNSDAAGEQVNPRGQAENGDPARQRRRSGGGLSAADLLRREGRL